MPSEEEVTQIAKMLIVDETTGMEIPDVEAQLKALRAIREREAKENEAAVAKQNEEAALTKTVWARPVAGSEHSEYDAFMHLSCTSEEPEGWSKLLINDTIRNNKCIGCGFALRKQAASSGN